MVFRKAPADTLRGFVRVRLQRLNSALDHGLTVKGTNLAWIFYDQSRAGESARNIHGVTLNVKTRQLSEFYFNIGGADGLALRDVRTVVLEPMAATLCYRKPN